MTDFELNKKGIDDFIKNLEEEVVPQKVIEEIQKIKCPACGKSATVKKYSESKLELDFCHTELEEKIEKELE